MWFKVWKKLSVFQNSTHVSWAWNLLWIIALVKDSASHTSSLQPSLSQLQLNSSLQQLVILQTRHFYCVCNLKSSSWGFERNSNLTLSCLSRQLHIGNPHLPIGLTGRCVFLNFYLGVYFPASLRLEGLHGACFMICVASTATQRLDELTAGQK